MKGELLSEFAETGGVLRARARLRVSRRPPGRNRARRWRDSLSATPSGGQFDAGVRRRAGHRRERVHGVVERRAFDGQRVRMGGRVVGMGDGELCSARASDHRWRHTDVRSAEREHLLFGQRRLDFAKAVNLSSSMAVSGVEITLDTPVFTNGVLLTTNALRADASSTYYFQRAEVSGGSSGDHARTAQAVSSTAPGFGARLAVDGDSTTAWSSAAHVSAARPRHPGGVVGVGDDQLHQVRPLDVRRDREVRAAVGQCLLLGERGMELREDCELVKHHLCAEGLEVLANQLVQDGRGRRPWLALPRS